MTKKYFFYTLLLFGVFSLQVGYAQDDIIRLQNPSFEDLPRAGKAPAGWYDCGFPGETPPDVQPETTFGVSRPAYDGGTYLGLVVRDTDTWERVGQRLTKAMQANQCYSFSLFLCRSPLYQSRSQKTDLMTNYVRPAKLIIWGGDQHCAKREQLGESSLVSNYNWKQFDFKLEPSQRHTYIMFEAFYETPVLFPYNGNILIDNASSIEPIPCDENVIAKVKAPEVDFIVPATNSQKVDDRGITVQARVKNVSPNLNITFLFNGRSLTDFYFDPNTGIFQADLKKFKEGRNTIQIAASNEAGDSQDRGVLIYEKDKPAIIADAPVNVPPAYEKPARPQNTPRKPQKPILENHNHGPESHENTNGDEMEIEGISRKNMKKGQTIKLNRLYFGINESSIANSDPRALDEIYRFLKYNPDVVIEIGGHTNGNCDDEYCDELSEARAKAVADYLGEKGIEGNRIQYKGYGKRKPISSNRTAVGRKKNQRVEIKILSMNG